MRSRIFHQLISTNARKPRNSLEVRYTQDLFSYFNRFLGLSAIMCLKPISIDVWISKFVDEKGAFEDVSVSIMLKAMSMYPHAAFLDIGSNIGMYSVMMAAAKRRVVAVDAVLHNLAYIHRSVVLQDNEKFVRLLNNPVRCEIRICCQQRLQKVCS